MGSQLIMLDLSDMAAKSILLSMEASKDLVLEKAGKFCIIFLDGKEMVSKLDQVIFIIVDGEKLR